MMFWVMTCTKKVLGKSYTGHIIRDASKEVFDKDGNYLDPVLDGEAVYDEEGNVLDSRWQTEEEAYHEYEMCQDPSHLFSELSESAGLPEYDNEGNLTLWMDEMPGAPFSLMSNNEVKKIKKRKK